MRRLIILLLVLTLGLAACGSDSEETGGVSSGEGLTGAGQPGGGAGGGGGGAGGGSCTPGYSPCLPPRPDYDCANRPGDGPGYAKGYYSVETPDPYDLDYDNDGLGCEE